MHPTQLSRMVEDRQSELRRAAPARRELRRAPAVRLVPRTSAPVRRTRAPVRGVGLLLVRLGQRLAGGEEQSGRRATTS